MSIYDDGLAPYPANYRALSPISFLERAATAFPAKAAIIDGPRQIDYATMLSRCRRFAAALRGRGIGLGDTVSLLSSNCPGMLEAHYGVPMAGAVINTINYKLDPATIAYILGHCAARLLMVSREHVALAEEAVAALGGGIELIALDGVPGIGPWQDYEAMLTECNEESAPGGPRDEWDAISLCYSSGTTGRPKGVVYHHRGAFLNALGTALAVGLSSRSVYLWTLPMFHCNGWTFTWAVTATGSTHLCQRAVVPARVFEAIVKHRVTHLCGAPTVLTMIANTAPDERKAFTHKVVAATGGAAPTSATIEAMEAMGFTVLHLYGLTETYGPILISEPQVDWRDLPVEERARLMSRQGVSLATGAQATVFDRSSGLPVAKDGKMLGEIAVRGNTVMKGYLKDPKATVQCFRDGWFHTGDLGVVHPDNYIEVKDRAKDIIISGGENISSIEVEEALSRHPAVLEVAVVAKPDPSWGETPCAFIALKPGMPEPSIDELTRWCRKHLAGFKRPRSFVFGALPKTSTGKVQKARLREMAAGKYAPSLEPSG